MISSYPARQSTRGVSLFEVCVGLALIALFLLVSLPSFSDWLDRLHLASAARHVSRLYQEHRYRAIAASCCFGMVFKSDPEVGSILCLMVRDGNGNGIRRVDVEQGIDQPVDQPLVLPADHGGVRFGLPLSSPIPVLPPGNGFIDHPSDPIRFGVSDIASFTPRGSSSSGTVYLLSPRGRVRAVRLYGITGRIQHWELITGSGGWVQR